MPKLLAPVSGCAWITGASTGIGRRLAVELAQSGWRVAITARRVELLQELAAQHPNLVAFAGDVTDAAGMAALVEQIEQESGPIMLAVLNAGTYKHESIEAINVPDFTHTIATNLLGVVHGLVPLLSKMRARRSGQVAIVSSVAGFTGLPGSLAYGASKAALINLAEALQIEAAPHNIKIQVVCPGFVDTPLTAQNQFPMPFMISAEVAVSHIINGLSSSKFEISFPWPMVMLLKVLRRLPYWLYLPLVRKATLKR